MSAESFSAEEMKNALGNLRADFATSNLDVPSSSSEYIGSSERNTLAEEILRGTLDVEETKKLNAEFAEKSIFETKKEFAGLVMVALRDNPAYDAPGENGKILRKKRKEARDLLELNLIDVRYMTGEGLPAVEDKKKVMREVRTVMFNILNDSVDRDRDTILERIKVPEDVLKKWKDADGARAATEPVPPTPPAPPAPPERPTPPENKKGNEKFRIQEQAHLEAYLQAFSRLGTNDYRGAIQRLKKEIDYLNNDFMSAIGNPDRQNEISALQSSISEKIKEFEGKNVSSEIDSIVENVPKDGSLKGQRKWFRNRMSNLVDPFGDENVRGNDLFGITVKTLGGLANKSFLLFASQEIQSEIKGATLPEGGNETGELEIASKMGKMFKEWRNCHSKVDNMVSAVAPDNVNYKFPDNNINAFLLNNLKGEDDGVKDVLGTEVNSPDGGSKNISKAVQIYWAMANKDVGGSGANRILSDFGLSDIKSLFNNELSDKEQKETRKRIAEKCGGSYYENYGLMYASFLGIIAKGNDKKSNNYGDAMSKLVHQGKINGWSDDEERYGGTRAGRGVWLPDTIATRLNEKDENGEDLRVRNEDGSYQPPTPIEFGVYPDTFQKSWGGKNFFLIRARGGKYIIKEDLPEGESDSGASFVDLIKQGKLHEIDWESSDNLFAIIKGRESKVIAVYTMFTKLEDTIEKLGDEKAISSYKDKIKKAFVQYSPETRSAIAGYWLTALIDKNSKAWTTEEKKEILKRNINLMREKNLISDVQVKSLQKRYSLTLSNQPSKWSESSFAHLFK